MNRHGSIEAIHEEEEDKLIVKHKNKDQNGKSPEGVEVGDDNNNKETSPKPKGCREKLRRFKIKYFPWIVCATSFIVQFFVLGFYKSFGPVYVKLLEPEETGGYGGSPLATSWVASLSISTSYLSTPISFEVIRRIKFRPAMLLGACLSGLGLFISSFADTVYTLYITFGLLFGLGSSLCYSCSLLILPRYHSTYWSLAHGIALAGNGLGGLGLSPANGALLGAYGLKTGFRIMAAVSFSVLFTCGLIYETPEEETKDDNIDQLDSDDEDFDENEEDETPPEEEVFYHDTLFANKPLLIFLFSTYMLNFGYYVPYVHLVKLAIDKNIAKTQADLLPGILSFAQSIGKVFIGKVFSYPSVNRMRAYQLSLVALCIATTFVPVLSNSYIGLLIYAVAFGFSDGCGQATNMIIIGDLAGKELLPKAYSTFLVCSASAFVVGPPIAGAVYTATGDYSIAFFMCGAMAFGSAILLFPVTCLREEEQVKYRTQKRKERAEAKKRREERRKQGLIEEEEVVKPKKSPKKDRRQQLRESQVTLLTRSWHSIDFKPHKSKSRESIRSRASRRTVELNEVKVDS